MSLSKPVTFDAKGATFVLALNFAAICQIEETLDMGFTSVLASLQKDARMRTLVALFRAMLLKDRPEITTDEAVGLIEDIGPARAAELIAAAVEASPLFNISGKTVPTNRAPRPARSSVKAG